LKLNSNELSELYSSTSKIPTHIIPSPTPLDLFIGPMGGPYMSNSKGSQQASQAVGSISAINVEIECDQSSVLPRLCVLVG